MSFRIKHFFESPKSDGGDATLVRPSNWNEDHVFDMDAGKVVGRDTSGVGDAQELPLAFTASGDADFTDGTGGLGVPTGTTAERLGSPRDGTFRYNSQIDAFEGRVSGAWKQLLSSTITFVTTMLGAAFNEAARVDLASSATPALGAAASNNVRITGTVTITGFDTITGGAHRHVMFAGVLVLTHNATSLILPTGANITTAAGDTAEFVSEGSGNWRCFVYQRASGEPLVPSSPKIVAMAKATGTTLNKQYNVTSVVKNSTGDYTFNFTANIDANAVLMAVALDPTESGDCLIATQSVSAVTVRTYDSGGGAHDFNGLYLTASA